MPWKETSPMEQRLEFVLRWIKHETGMAELCRLFGISRTSGYALVAAEPAHKKAPSTAKFPLLFSSTASSSEFGALSVSSASVSDASGR